MTINNQTERYDVEEDRADDVKRHDNPNHASKHCNDVREYSAEEAMKNFLKVDGYWIHKSLVDQYYLRKQNENNL